MAKKNVKNPETKVVCPKCGTEFAIADKEHLAIGIVIGKDSGLGTISPAVADESSSVNKSLSKMTAEAKIEALRKAGVNVNNLFSMKGANGGEDVVRMVNGQFSVVWDDDPIYKSILENGTVPNARLFRRWVMSQVFHMMTYQGYHGDSGFIAALQAKGYKYQWKMLLEELRVQSKLQAKDPENFAARNHWFNGGVVFDICDDYIQKLRKHVEHLKVRHCKGIPYVRLGAKNFFVSDLKSKVFKPLQIIAGEIIQSSQNMFQLYRKAFAFYNIIKVLWMQYDIPMSQRFKDAYKGAGAYFTMKNLILFHGARFKNGCCKYSEAKSLLMLEARNHEYEDEGWKLFGVMKKLIADNNIDIEKKMAEWRK